MLAVKLFGLFVLCATSESFVLDDLTELRGEDVCSPRVALTRSFKLGNDVINYLYVCQNGYISLGSGEPDILTSPGDYNMTLNRTIMAPALMKNDDLANVGMLGGYYGELEDSEKQWAGGDGDDDDDDDDDVEIIDPFFLPEFAFMAMWPAFDSEANTTRAVSLTLACDKEYPTSEGKTDKCALVVYYDTLVKVQDVNTNEYMRTGVYAPSGTVLELPYSGTAQVTRLVNETNVNDRGFWVYEIDQEFTSGDMLKTYVKSNCNNFADDELPKECKIGYGTKNTVSVGILWIMAIFQIAYQFK